jgi:hypothetical protein
VGAWSNCSAACGTGAALRPVACLSGATGAPARDEGACGARARPPAAQPCAGPAGAMCGAQPGGAACSNHGVRAGGRCQCDAGYRGLFCELLVACDGFPDSSGDCCMTVVDRRAPPPNPSAAPEQSALLHVRARACGGGRLSSVPAMPCARVWSGSGALLRKHRGALRSKPRRASLRIGRQSAGDEAALPSVSAAAARAGTACAAGRGRRWTRTGTAASAAGWTCAACAGGAPRSSTSPVRARARARARACGRSVLPSLTRASLQTARRRQAGACKRVWSARDGACK